MLERYAMKVARTVLRGGSGSNVTPLPDHWTGGDSAPFQAVSYASAFFSSRTLYTPTHPPVTPAVRRPQIGCLLRGHASSHCFEGVFACVC